MSRSRYESPEQKKEREDKAALEKFRQEKLLEDCNKLLQTDEFKRVMSEIIGMGGIFRTVMTGNAATYHRAGEQDYAKRILIFLMKADKAAAFELLKPQHINLE